MHPYNISTYDLRLGRFILPIFYHDRLTWLFYKENEISYRSSHDGGIAERSWGLLDIAPSSVLVYQIYIASVWRAGIYQVRFGANRHTNSSLSLLFVSEKFMSLIDPISKFSQFRRRVLILLMKEKEVSPLLQSFNGFQVSDFDCDDWRKFAQNATSNTTPSCNIT